MFGCYYGKIKLYFLCKMYSLGHGVALAAIIMMFLMDQLFSDTCEH